MLTRTTHTWCQVSTCDRSSSHRAVSAHLPEPRELTLERVRTGHWGSTRITLHSPGFTATLTSVCFPFLSQKCPQYAKCSPIYHQPSDFLDIWEYISSSDFKKKRQRHIEHTTFKNLIYTLPFKKKTKKQWILFKAFIFMRPGCVSNSQASSGLWLWDNGQQSGVCSKALYSQQTAVLEQ